MKTLIAPGVRLMRRLSLVNKLLLVSFFMLLPLAYTALLYLGETRKQIDFMADERDGLSYIKPLLQLSRLAQEHRGMTYIIAKGDDRLKQARINVQEKILAVVTEIDKVETELGAAYGSAPRLRSITNRLKPLLQADVPTDAEGVFTEHGALIEEIHG